MAGVTTVRHIARTTSSFSHSTSEPETQRPLITPQEVLTLDEDAALVLPTGMPAVLARKIKYYTDPFFMRRRLAPPAASDRIRGTDDGTGT